MKKTVTLFAAILSFTLAAQNNLQYVSSTKGGGCYEVCYYNNYLYAGAGSTLTVYDVTVPVPYPKVGEYRFRSFIDKIQVENGYLYVSANHSGLFKMDISSPANPFVEAFYTPAQNSEAVYDVAFYGGDTLFVAYKSNVTVLRDMGNYFQFVTTINPPVSGGKIRGIDVKDSLLAFTLGYDNVQANEGVYVYDARTFTQKDFYSYGYCDPEGVFFGQNTDLIHVMGGSNSITSGGGDVQGLYYVLNCADPSNLQFVYGDTLPAVPGFEIASAMNAEIVNDTVYLVTQASGDMANPNWPIAGHVYVYDATGPAVIPLTGIYAGLWFFDIAINNDTMFVASEWYGVKTVDISDIYNEVDLGNTLTGGWNLGADKLGNRMVLANEGNGIKLYDVNSIYNPLLLAEDNPVGFCASADFSATGSHIYSHYLTDTSFRVYDSNLNVVGSLTTFAAVSATRTQVWQDKHVCFRTPIFGTGQIQLIDVSTPSAPQLDTAFTQGLFKDMVVTTGGKLLVSIPGSIRVFDMSSNLSLLNTVNGQVFKNFDRMAYYKDTLYVYVDDVLAANADVIKRYKFDAATNSLTYIDEFAPPQPEPQFMYMAVDSFGLYVAYTKYGFYALNKNTGQQTGYYEHGKEHIHDFLWGVQDLFCRDGYIFLVEYFSQTTVLTNNDGVMSLQEPARNDAFSVFPNPGNGNFTVHGLDGPGVIEVFTSGGQLLYQLRHDGEENIKVDISFLPPGIYLLKAGTGIQKIVIGE